MMRIRLVLLGCLLVCAGCGRRSTADWVAQLTATEPVERLKAVRTLQERKGEAEVVVPALTAALRDEDVYVRRDAARALGTFGVEARSAIPALREAQRDRESSVRKAAGLALAQIEPASADPSATRPQPRK